MKTVLATLMLTAASAEIFQGKVDLLTQGPNFPMQCVFVPLRATLKFPAETFTEGCTLTTSGDAVIDGTIDSDGSIVVKSIQKVSFCTISSSPPHQIFD
jgi:hypothetical protein